MRRNPLIVVLAGGLAVLLGGLHVAGAAPLNERLRRPTRGRETARSRGPRGPKRAIGRRLDYRLDPRSVRIIDARLATVRLDEGLMVKRRKERKLERERLDEAEAAERRRAEVKRRRAARKRETIWEFRIRKKDWSLF